MESSNEKQFEKLEDTVQLLVYNKSIKLILNRLS